MSDAALEADKAEIEQIIHAAYAMISGPAGPRNWTDQARYFHPDCRQIRTGVDADGVPWHRMFSPEAFRADVDVQLAATDFHEIALVNRIEVFGNIAQAWSSYEAKHHPDDAWPERRGINGFHFYRGPAGHWQIIAMIWDNERDGTALPPEMVSAR